MRDELFKTLEARWHELYDQYESVKAALPPVVRREWTTMERYDPRPFYFERHPPRGRALKQSPQNDDARSWRYEYGFDNRGEVVVENNQGFSAKFTKETFYTHTPEKIEITTYFEYKGRKLLNAIAWGIMQSGTMRQFVNLSLDYNYGDEEARFPAPMQTERYAAGSTANATAAETWARLSTQRYAARWGYTEYTYDDKRLVRVRYYYIEPQSQPIEGEDKFEYDVKGRLQKINWLRPDGYGRTVYYKRAPGETIPSMTEKVITKLLEMIPKAMAEANFSEPLYCLNLYYFRAKTGSYFPPTLYPGLEKDRQRKLQEHGADRALYYIWWYLWEFDDDDVELTPRLHITDPETLEICNRLEVEINSRWAGWRGAKILRQLARELNKLNWSQYAPVTPDFIVYACDQTEHEEIAASLRYSGATKEQLADWRKHGLL
ncbi:MAG: hypothetical protein K8I30_08795 [Anaerolineae bacterium]|nr:hypothetical protein [Anaerolineae bacterium]